MNNHEVYEAYLAHYGVKGMKWGIRRSKRVQAVRDRHARRESQRAKQFRRDRAALYDRAKQEWREPGNTLRTRSGLILSTALRRDMLNGDSLRAKDRNRKLLKKELRAARRADRSHKRYIRDENRLDRNNLDRSIAKAEERGLRRVASVKRASDKQRRESIQNAKGLRKVPAAIRAQREYSRRVHSAGRSEVDKLSRYELDLDKKYSDRARARKARLYR